MNESRSGLDTSGQRKWKKSHNRGSRSESRPTLLRKGDDEHRQSIKRAAYKDDTALPASTSETVFIRWGTKGRASDDPIGDGSARPSDPLRRDALKDSSQMPAEKVTGELSASPAIYAFPPGKSNSAQHPNPYP